MLFTSVLFFFFFFQAEDGIRDDLVTGVQTCALPISWFLPACRDYQWRQVALATKDVGYRALCKVQCGPCTKTGPIAWCGCFKACLQASHCCYRCTWSA